MPRDYYGTRFAVELPRFAGQHEVEEEEESDPDFGDVTYAVQGAMLEFVERCRPSASALHSLENGLRVLGQALCPTSAATASREQAMGNVAAALLRIGVVAPFGSWVSGLHTPGGDLDLSLDGWLEWVSGPDSCCGYAEETKRKDKKAVLRSATKLLVRRGAADGWVEQILRARVPIIKFTESSAGLACDVSVDGRAPLFKSALLGQLAAADWRVGALVRLVKAWAREQGINSAGDGTLSSHALTLMVVWHLQMRSPAVLPPLSQLFKAAEPPLQEGTAPQMTLLQGSAQRLRNLRQNANRETLVELLASFFTAWHALLCAWLDSGRNRRVVASTWHGDYSYNESKAFRSSVFSVEEPTNSEDNVTRSVHSREKAIQVAAAFRRAELLVRHAMGHRAAVESALEALFGSQFCRSSGALRQLDADSVAPVPIVPMRVPDSLRKFVNSRLLPTPAAVNHQRPR